MQKKLLMHSEMPHVKQVNASNDLKSNLWFRHEGKNDVVFPFGRGSLVEFSRHWE